MAYRGFIFGYEMDEQEHSLPTLWHYVEDTVTAKRYYLNHSYLSWPLREDFERRVNEVLGDIAAG